jgi:hypothetical protein
MTSSLHLVASTHLGGAETAFLRITDALSAANCNLPNLYTEGDFPMPHEALQQLLDGMGGAP